MKLRELIWQKENKKKFFYSIEVLANNETLNSICNFKKFISIQPVFVSLVWLGESYSREKSLYDVTSIKVAQKLQQQYQHQHLIVMPHLSCYGLTKEKLKQFLQFQFPSALIVRGDQLSTTQEYLYASHLIKAIRELENMSGSISSRDPLTIAVAAYPEGHPLASTKPENMENLLAKIMAGADIIITQMCFRATTIIEFIKCCRAHSIHLPILIGIFIPFDMACLNTFLKITKVTIASDLLKAYQEKALEDNNDNDLASFHNYAVKQAVELILSIFKANIGIYGIHFYTMNNFDMIRKVLDELKNHGEIFH